ncbi:DUF58 domain-containing protein [Xanthomonas sacchari]|uniref:DUF58 domain-containing protein n=1 Tax=Xanthomonas sacchari TaxID=56458 RepID=UPI0009E208B8|nr:DUF58 domain-containing protein [Xanthomonas sacchari]
MAPQPTAPGMPHAAAPAEAGIRPSLAELVALRAAVARVPTPRRGRHGLSGAAPSPMRGRGMEYAESREYVAGDDVRHIDWRLTARSGRTHTKLFQAERERLSLIVADTAPSLYFGTRVRFKSVQAARAGAVAAWAAQRQGDRLAALRGSRSEAPVPPASGPRGVLRVLDALARWYAQPPQDDAGLGMALDHAAKLLRPGSRLTVLADPASAQAVPAARWAALALHNEVELLLLADPLEVQPPRAALPFWASGRRVEVDLLASAAQQRWRAQFVQPLETLAAELPGRGVQVRVLLSDAPSEAWLLPVQRSGAP